MASAFFNHVVGNRSHGANICANRKRMSMMNLRSLQWPALRGVQKCRPMASLSYRDWVRAGLLKKGKSKGGLAKALGIHQSQITRLVEGKRQLKAEEVSVVADYLGLPSPDTETKFEAEVADETGAPMVKVVGYVGAGAQRHFYSVAQGDLDEVPVPGRATPDTVAVEVRGDSLGSLFDRWLVFYDEIRRPVTSDLFGHLCVIGLADDRVLIKKLRRAGDGYFDLISNDGTETIRHVVVEWAAKVKGMVPR